MPARPKSNAQDLLDPALHMHHYRMLPLTHRGGGTEGEREGYAPVTVNFPSVAD